MTQYVMKSSWEIISTPVTYKLVNFLKRAEHEDYYDRNTNFTPFSLRVTASMIAVYGNQATVKTSSK